MTNPKPPSIDFITLTYPIGQKLHDIHIALPHIVAIIGTDRDNPQGCNIRTTDGSNFFVRETFPEIFRTVKGSAESTGETPPPFPPSE